MATTAVSPGAFAAGQIAAPAVGNVPVFGAYAHDSWIEFQNSSLFCAPVIGYGNPVTLHGWVEVDAAQLEKLKQLKAEPAAPTPVSEVQVASKPDTHVKSSSNKPQELFVGQGSPIRKLSSVMVGMGSDIRTAGKFPTLKPDPNEASIAAEPLELFEVPEANSHQAEEPAIEVAGNFPPVDLLGELVVPEFDASEHAEYLQTVAMQQDVKLPMSADQPDAPARVISKNASMAQDSVLENDTDTSAESSAAEAVLVQQFPTSIHSISLDMRPSGGELPVRKVQPVLEERESILRAPITVSWHASRLEHNPLYFEDQLLERQGFTHGDILQPLVSGAKFFGTIPILPYLMTVNHPHECQSVLGDRPVGTADCYRPDTLPKSLKGAVVEAGVVTGLIFFIP